jgi:two-component system nitrate/nitrite response regulator NarL
MRVHIADGSSIELRSDEYGGRAERRDEGQPMQSVAGVPSDSGLDILIVSPVRLLRDGLATMLRQRENVRSVHTAESAEVAAEAVARLMPTLILLDVATEDGLSVARRLAGAAADVQILGFAARAHDHDVLAYASAGITGFVPREASADDLFDAIDRAFNGELLCSPRVAAALFRQVAVLSNVPRPNGVPAQLTGRELEIVRFIDEGFSNKEIARRLSIQVSTVKNHVHNILEKLNVTRRAKVPARVRVIGLLHAD